MDGRASSGKELVVIIEQVGRPADLLVVGERSRRCRGVAGVPPSRGSTLINAADNTDACRRVNGEEHVVGLDDAMVDHPPRFTGAGLSPSGDG